MKIMIVNSKISKNPKQFWGGSEIYLILFFTLLFTTYIILEGTLHVT